MIKLQPKVSVVIPTYNYAHFIRETIESVINQNFKDYEIIVIDDGSTDNTREILQPYFDCIYYVYQNNQGLSEARNHGIRLAKGKWVIFLDADDFFLPNILTELVRVFEAQPSLGLVICGWHITNEQGKIISTVELWNGLPKLDLEAWVQWRPLLPSATLFRKDWLEQMGGFQTEAFPAEDIDCVLRMVVQGCQSDWLRKVGVCYRQHGKTITQNTPRQAQAFERLYDRFFARADLPISVRQLENSTRYNSLIWTAWRLYHTGRFQEMGQYFRKSLNYTVNTPASIISSWIEFLVTNCSSYGYELDVYSLTQSPVWQELMMYTLSWKKPRVSIIIPAYNAGQYIQQSLDSIFNQTYSDYEIIVVDDGSTDNTCEILQPYTDKIRYVYQENQGVSEARNHGLYLARGELIALLDADDWFLPHKLEEQVAIFDTQPFLAIVNSGFRIINEYNEVIQDVEWWHTIPELTEQTWLLYKPVLPSAMMFRREWLQKVGGFDSRLTAGEDIDIVLRMVALGCKATWLPKVTACYRIHQSSATLRNTPKQARCTEKMLDNFFAQSNLPESMRALERQSRYQTLVWIAWLLYHTGYLPEMAEYLQKSLDYTSDSWAKTVSDWITSFTNSTKGFGYDFDSYALTQSQEWKWILSKIGIET